MQSYKLAKYIAMGLSLDREMGDDSVMECVKDGNEVKLYQSYTVVGDHYEAQRNNVVSLEVFG